MFWNISLQALYSFFDWMLNQRRGKGGRRLRGTKTTTSLGTYWKFFRLVYKSKTGSKINPTLNRQIHQVLRKLAKKHGLSSVKREKTVMYVKALVEVEQTNLTTTKKYSYSRHRIQVALFL